eukprot:CAMPEP_0195507592 /NCGR_PEP_ID=MMETSP0794_2-20130614/1008_1 /TAXON_ID=515487 /ORGANISM="Stephanopyxis turris, Strain CCMP 815" /LENGTH=781 /DNA_ID=CAMNT_0040634329 /DNA_START=63 /DNA_END=2408 /DNA_ORIENTATION=-
MTAPAETEQPTGYPIDVRVLIAAMASTMALAFGAGVVFGPTPAFPNHNEDIKAMESPNFESGELARNLMDLGSKIKETHVNVGEAPSYESIGSDFADRRNGSLAFPLEGDNEEELAGQHLLVDMKNVNADFLNSEPRLAQALVDVTTEAKIPLLSYHCHSLEPAGVSCVGVLLESHISFHTWPEDGLMTLDVFTCTPTNLISVVPTIEKMFGVPQENASEKEKVLTMWSHELRGFKTDESRKTLKNGMNSDMTWWVTSPLEMLHKKEIVSVQSDFQRIDIWDVLDVGDTPSYKDMLKHNLEEGDPRFFTSELASPERLLFLDGKLQSMSETDHEYHESLVHPAMFAHTNPKRVSIIGGGEGATLREVLKHRTVEEVKMIEIDAKVIEIAREFLPYNNDCSDLVGVAKCCFDDPRAEIFNIDAQHWFISRYGSDVGEVKEEDKFNVIILDALNPEDENINANGLFTDPEFLNSMLNSLTDDGVIVIQAGTAPTIHDPAPDKGKFAQREKLFLMLEEHSDTAAMLVYEEAHCGFNEPHSFLVICKSHTCRKQWYAGADAIDFQIYERIAVTHSKERALQHFDGSTQYSYQYPPKAWETVYCRREPTPFECAYRGLDMDAELRDLTEDEESSDFYIEKMEDGEVGVFASNAINKGDYIMPEALASSFVISDDSKSNLVDTTKIMGTGSTLVLDNFLEFIDKHGHRSISEGIGSTIVEVGGTFLIRSVASKEDANVDRMIPRPAEGLPTYSPVYERNRRSFDVFLVASRDIAVDEEILKYDGIWD